MKEIILTDEELQSMLDAAAVKAVEKYASTHKTKYLTRYEVARRLGVDKSTLWRWHTSGYFRGVKRGRCVFYSLESVEKFENGERVI